MQYKLVTDLRPAVVINAAAERRPDVCESDDSASEILNIDAVYTLGRAAAKAGAKFIHISTDYVFDGTAAPYREDAPPTPLNAYGRQKVRGEYAALAAHATPCILRVPVLYGPTNDLSESAITVFVQTVMDTHKPRVLDDWQIRVPTYTPDVAKTLLNICNAYITPGASCPTGIFHYSSADRTTRYKISQLLADIMGLGTSVSHVTADANPPPGAPRPYDAALDTSKLRALGLAHPNTPLREGLEHVLRGAKVIS